MRSTFPLVALTALASASHASVIVSSGSITVPGTWLFDFDAGVIGGDLVAPYDIFWEQFNPTQRAVMRVNFVTLAPMGVVDFASIGIAELLALSYTSSGIDGSDVGSVLVPGFVFAVHTDQNNYAKVRITGPLVNTANHGLPIEWVTYVIPTHATLIPLAAATIVACRRRRIGT
jgi:hypothetical protein